MFTLRGRRSKARLARGFVLACACWSTLQLCGSLRGVVTSFVSSSGALGAWRPSTLAAASTTGGQRGAGPLRTALAAKIRVKNPPGEGEREIVDGPDGPIVVTNVDGAYFAVDATCPHLGLPMKRGKVERGDDGPRYVCSFHNSCWKMKTGECTRWVTGALGVENEFISGVMGSIGGQKSDIATYEVEDAGDGYLWLEPRAARQRQ